MRVIRVFQWDDPHRGWGDAGTLAYVEVDDSMVEKYTIERLNGDKFQKEKLSQEGLKFVEDKICEVFGRQIHDIWITYGLDISSEEERDRHIRKLEKQVEFLKSFKG